jgi:hypothetical protein
MALVLKMATNATAENLPARNRLGKGFGRDVFCAFVRSCQSQMAPIEFSQQLPLGKDCCLLFPFVGYPLYCLADC